MNNEKGSVLILPALFIFILILIGLVIDLGLAFAGRNYVQTAAEAASLAGAMSVELQVETITIPDPEDPIVPPEVTYEYYARIVPERAEQAAHKMISKYSGAYGISIKDVSHYFYTEDKTKYPLLDAIGRDDLIFVEYETVISAEQKTLLSFVWNGEFRCIEVGNVSDAKMEFVVE